MTFETVKLAEELYGEIEREFEGPDGERKLSLEEELNTKIHVFQQLIDNCTVEGLQYLVMSSDLTLINSSTISTNPLETETINDEIDDASRVRITVINHVSKRLLHTNLTEEEIKQALDAIIRHMQNDFIRIKKIVESASNIFSSYQLKLYK